jgi:8-hydroxy-5-deazaflavin:NADPH oxidoreductase
MKVGVLGSGIVGQVLGTGFIKHGHQVMMGTQDPGSEAVRKWLLAGDRGGITC